MSHKNKNTSLTKIPRMPQAVDVSADTHALRPRDEARNAQIMPSHAGTAPRVLSAKLVNRDVMHQLTGSTRGRQRSPKLQGNIFNPGRGIVVDAATREEGIAASKVLSAVIREALDHESGAGERTERTSPIKLLTWDRK